MIWICIGGRELKKEFYNLVKKLLIFVYARIIWLLRRILVDGLDVLGVNFLERFGFSFGVLNLAMQIPCVCDSTVKL